MKINYGRTEEDAPDAFEMYLAAAPSPNENDPIRYWARHRAASQATNNADGVGLAQMALDYLLASATSIDPE